MKTLAPLFAAALLIPLAGCGSSPAAPNVTTPPTTTTTTTIPSDVNLTGTWTGTGKDAQGPETFRWTVTQTGDRIAGAVVIDPTDPADGTCGSCHKQKTGTVSGTLSGSALTLTLDFPAGGADLTPLCGITMNASATDVAADRIVAAYTGTTTCEGPITDGTLVVVR
jgi:hypothetical protein